jgi:catechol 2,3-dioxygenase-like lactoylglutathione lyase family enzyme
VERLCGSTLLPSSSGAMLLAVLPIGEAQQCAVEPSFWPRLWSSRLSAPGALTSWCGGRSAVARFSRGVRYVSIEVDDVDKIYQRAKSAGLEVTYGIVDEPWGVRRFYLRDPFGRILNTLSHWLFFPETRFAYTRPPRHNRLHSVPRSPAQ